MMFGQHLGKEQLQVGRYLEVAPSPCCAADSLAGRRAEIVARMKIRHHTKLLGYAAENLRPGLEAANAVVPEDGDLPGACGGDGGQQTQPHTRHGAGLRPGQPKPRLTVGVGGEPGGRRVTVHHGARSGRRVEHADAGGADHRRDTACDGGPATEARIQGPGGVAVDAVGNLFLADHNNHRIRKVSPDGLITTVAGSGVPGFSGDGGLAVEASLRGPIGVAVDTEGTLFIADFDNYRVRKVDANGVISTVAGIGLARYAGDGVLATTTACVARACWP